MDCGRINIFVIDRYTETFLRVCGEVVVSDDMARRLIESGEGVWVSGRAARREQIFFLASDNATL